MSSSELRVCSCSGPEFLLRSPLPSGASRCGSWRRISPIFKAQVQAGSPETLPPLL